MRKKGNWLEHVSKLIWRTLVSNLRGLVLGSVEAGFSSQQFVITVTEKYTICATTEHMRMYTIGCNIFWPNNCMFPKGPSPESNTKRLQRAVERQLRGAEARARAGQGADAAVPTLRPDLSVIAVLLFEPH